MTASLIISTYNWPGALKLVLESALKQTVLPDEILIADDGSTSETKNLVEEFQQKTSLPIHHIWHQDDGFRLAEIRNKSIKAAASDYIIQIDGDTVLHPDFVKNHLRLAETNTFLSGSRVLLSEEVSKIAEQENLIKFSPFSNGIKNRFNATYLPLLNIFRKPKNEPLEKLIFKVRGCNMSFWKKDLLEVNGYNEDIKGWGREDSEIALRLLKKGVGFKKIKNAAIQYHLHHKEAPKNQLAFNDQLLSEAKKMKGFTTRNGIEKL